ncbi:MAG: hypothetical protein IPM34_00235 [Saprospiraceae bacterium]|nr:hypothetical protein [Saprospiraceae bacterium]
MKNVFKFLLPVFVLCLSSVGIELKAQDVAKAAPNVYKLISDTLGIRLFEIEFEPGESAAFHKHPDHAVYVLTPGILEITHADGKKETLEFQSGFGGVFPSEGHSARNLTQNTIKAIVVEVSRKR